MRRMALLGIGVALAVALAAPGAHGCGQGGYPSGGTVLAVGLGALAFSSADVVLTVYDLGTLAAGPRSMGYGVFEVILSLPQLALGIAGLSQPNQSSSGFFTGYTIWMAALAVHGIWSIAAAPRAAPAIDSPDPPPVQDSPRLELGIGPTYAPVGQLAHPGFGLIGRF